MLRMTKCLVIDESSIVAKVATRILAGIEIETSGAFSLEEASAQLGSEPLPALVIVSASLVGVPVEKAVKALRAMPGGAKAAILVSIVETNLGVMTRAKRAGSDGFIFRPFDRASLLAWIEPFVKVAA
jgi:two-component system chemotaxis response regulator CheY